MESKNSITTFPELMHKLTKYITDDEELKIIENAYNLALTHHEGQKRMTGEDYIIHPLNVAYILTAIYADFEAIAAALMHDLIEDCDVTYNDIYQEFGKNIANLVESVTKINRLSFSTDNESVIENHKKIIVGLVEDVRVIVIKVADRLHNMRTLWVHPEKRQREKAKETLEIITPLAHHLGIHKLKSELEDLSLRYLKPDAYYDIVEKLNKTKLERDVVVSRMIDEVSEILQANNINHKIKGRSKSIYSIYNKLSKGKKFRDIYDLLALRIIVDEKQECYATIGFIHSKFKPIQKRFKDYIAMPKGNMYQSLHTTIFGYDDFVFEIQIRTEEMDQIAEFGVAAHWSYKAGDKEVKKDIMEQKLDAFRSIIELNKDDMSSEEFVNTIKEEILDVNVYVYTPKGDVIELPNGSTPIDFAYKVHTAVGNKMVGAIVNNSIVPLDYELKNGDIIKVNTSNNQVGPSRSWEKIVKTTQARNKIKGFFTKQDKEVQIKLGEELLVKTLRNKRFVIEEFYKTENLDKIFKELKIKNTEDLYLQIGSYKFTAGSVVNILRNTDAAQKEAMLKKIITNKDIDSDNLKKDIIVEGIDNIKVSLANCCSPIPGDNIIGYVSTGRGISIHRSSCHNANLDQERVIDVRWNSSLENKKFKANVLVRTSDKDDIVLDISKHASLNDISLNKVKTMHDKDGLVYDIIVLVKDTEKLGNFVLGLKQEEKIIMAERIIK